MKLLAISAGAALLMGLTGCQSIPAGAERGPHGTMAYHVPVETSEPGARIEVNGEFVGHSPLTLKIFGDPDGTFHDFGSYEYVVRAYPVRTNQFVQTRAFKTGRMFSGEDFIPSQIYFDLNQPPPVVIQVPVYSPPVYYHPHPYYYYSPPPVYRYHRPGIHVRPPPGSHRLHHR